MSIRFTCPECHQALHVADRQAGASVRCARCHQKVQVPQHSQDVPFDLPAEGDLETASSAGELRPQLDTLRFSASRDHVRVHRRVVYAQGMLLVVVGIACFACGFLAARYRGAAGPPKSETGPHLLVGQVGYYDVEGSWTPDEGSVLLALPEELQPDEKVSAEDLRVGTRLPNAVHPALAALEMLGGAYARADAAGRFRLRLPDADRYHVIAISANTKRHEAETPDQETLALLGRFFIEPAEFLGDQQYETRHEPVAGTTEVEITFRAARSQVD